MTAVEIIEELKKVDGVYETYQVISTFQFFRKAKNGNNQTVTVEIFDAGQNSDPHFRYHCSAISDDGRSATCNPDSSVNLLYWHEASSF